MAVVLATSPAGWAQWTHEHGGAPVTQVLDQLLVLLNTHMALQHNNQLALFVTAPDGAHLVFPAAAGHADRFRLLSATDKMTLVRIRTWW